MDAAEAIRELTELSSQIEFAVVLGADGSVLASTQEDFAKATALASSTLELVAAAFDLNTQRLEVTRVEVELEDGALFVLRDSGRTIAATTGPDPTSGLVVYDLRTCLQGIAEEPKKKRRTARKAKEDSE
ncbi:MAG: roadblock/LC7 domain-containing protein [Thermoleophilia bacterium]|nr:roadblock/LC7 domain-containing protein [Thermoleophilia bacterium]MDH4340735.1 roadblock/LC7 domain-containing protein [Thermoleophilia bacterium]MDH5280057.1 roadblock/LC7 domain-containing protein [Thermoleophilia bacterium]